MSDIFQEVEEDVRRERYEELWKKYGNYVIALASLIVLGVAVWQFWQRYELTQRQTASDSYEDAIAVGRTGDAAKAEAAFSAIANSSTSGYQTLAKFELATAYLAQGKRDPAVAMLRELVQSSDPLISSPARLRLAWTLADASPKPEIATLLAPLLEMTNPWRFAAQEVLTYLDLMQGSRNDAQAGYERLAAEVQAPMSLRSRATAIANYIKANPVGAPPAAVPAPTPAPAAAPAAPAAAPAAGQSKGTPAK